MKKHFFESPEHYIQRLVMNLNNKEVDDTIRLASIKALGVEKEKVAVNALINALKKYDWNRLLSEAIEDALGETGDPDALLSLIEKMEKCFSNPFGPHASHTLIKAVASFGDKRATDVLINALSHFTLDQHHARNSEVVIDGLAKIGRPAAEKIAKKIQYMNSNGGNINYSIELAWLQTALRKVGG